MAFKYKHALLGGTFDRFHLGHRQLLNAALEQSARISVGITTNEMVKSKFLSQTIEDYQTRKKYIETYLLEKNAHQRSQIVCLTDIYGIALENQPIDAIFVTRATYTNAKQINAKRKELGLKKLKIITVPFKRGEDEQIINSERIRYGEINRNGQAYKKLFQDKKLLVLPANLRETLRQPIGEVFQDVNDILLQKPFFLITVGDIVTKLVTEAGQQPDVSIIDFKTQRHTLDKKFMRNLLQTDSKAYRNDHGTINKYTINVFQRKLKTSINSHTKQTIIINGEEDLLTLPIILLAPLEAYVLYGQRDVGTILVKVTEAKKKEVARILEKFV